MRSHLPKVLHTLGDRPILAHVLDLARAFSPQRLVIVIGHEAEAIQASFCRDRDIHWAFQREQRGTAHALQSAMGALADSDRVLVLFGDVPLLTVATVQRLLEAFPAGGLALLTAEVRVPYGYGRIVRASDGHVAAIVEEKDCSPAQREISEINTGVMLVEAAVLRRLLPRVEPHNAQKELYLTDLVGLARDEGLPVSALPAANEEEIGGINSRVQLAAAERILMNRICHQLMDSGVSMKDPGRVDIRGVLRCGRDVVLDVNTIFEGEVSLGDGVQVGAGCILRNCEIGAGAVVHPYSVIDGAVIGDQCQIGPFARLRPGTDIRTGAHIGNFVEVKNSSVGEGSKANHLAYIGDTTMGAGCNIGAGTITCNYDGANKHRTVIGDDVFVGSDTQLVAPVRVGDGATIGAGSTITRDVPAKQLSLSRASQTTVPRWERPRKKEHS